MIIHAVIYNNDKTLVNVLNLYMLIRNYVRCVFLHPLQTFH